MNPLTDEWIQKAEEDFTVAQREMRARKAPSFGAVCFHSQQCAEKYLKACLHDVAIYFDKTHNLVKLLDQIVKLEPAWNVLRQALQELTTHAVEVRYPGYRADRPIARTSLTTCKQLRTLARARLKLPAESGLRSRQDNASKRRNRTRF